jgi:hypothetical protein
MHWCNVRLRQFVIRTIKGTGLYNVLNAKTIQRFGTDVSEIDMQFHIDYSYFCNRSWRPIGL